ncbi:hypothetical protein QP575_08055 [Alcaligenes faecalis subsp. phenolicus]|uniref:hypothetical protein n=1 Tax=Alcaligenes nematophilus TaxID=2994643 RepID=UPI002AA2D9CD|nr:hypothetical protein [Alcaligenes phenolicus]
MKPNENVCNAFKGLFVSVLDKGDIHLAFDLGKWLLKSEIYDNTILKNTAVCAIKIGKEKDLILMLEEKEEGYPDRYFLKNIQAGLCGTAKLEEESRRYAMEMAKIKPFSERKLRNAKINVLVLQTVASGAYRLSAKKGSFHIGEGHNNLHSLLDPSMAKSILRVDDLEAAKKAIQGKDFDIVFNNISDPERCRSALENAKKICEEINAPVINSPESVMAASREGNYEKIGSSDFIKFPISVKLKSSKAKINGRIARVIKENNISLPIIARVSGFQAGKHMKLVNDPVKYDFSEFDGFVKNEGRDIYVIQYFDTYFEDERIPGGKLYKKYRAFMVGGKIFPVHLFVANNDFNVHRRNSVGLMRDNSWLIDMEKDYCSDPEGHIGIELWKELEKTMVKTGLDYQGVDFSVYEDKGVRKIVIFEINSAMRNSMLSLVDRPHTQKSWREITTEVHKLFCAKSGVDKWDFSLKK